MSEDELEEQDGQELPPREAMSFVDLELGRPVPIDGEDPWPFPSDDPKLPPTG